MEEWIMATKKLTDTPMMQQFKKMKDEYPDAILLFRVGDFYETYGKDAVAISSILHIILTKKGNGSGEFIEMAGVPYHAVNGYLAKLIRAGFRVAVCDQLEDPKFAKGLVKRGITELITPGTVLTDTLLDGKVNNFLCAIAIGKEIWGISFLDLSTGEFLTAEGSAEYVEKLVAEFEPKEIIYDREKKSQFQEHFSKWNGSIFEMEDWAFSLDATQERLKKQFSTANLKGFGIEEWKMAQIASGTILCYLDMTKHTLLEHLLSIHRIDEKSYVHLDSFTIRNLELFSPTTFEGKSLIEVIDRTLTPCGGRMLRRWLMLPLCQKEKILQRQECINDLLKNVSVREELQKSLPLVGDLERMISKLSLKRINPKEVLALGVALEAIEHIKILYEVQKERSFSISTENTFSLHEEYVVIKNTICEDTPMLLSKGGVIKDG
ncbi:MAG TPA: DNA mismatch repair protein MutS, partial [Porphyromonadaceae bacterium]|nr:DNA mismatch repair protein MutS [Porphyromonadaceae bacterium]